MKRSRAKINIIKDEIVSFDQKNPIQKVRPARRLPESHGRRVLCAMGCGRQALEKIGVCRKCRKAGRIKAARTLTNMQKSGSFIPGMDIQALDVQEASGGNTKEEA